MTSQQAPDALPFGIKFSREALAARRTLPESAKYALAAIIDELFEDATRFLEHGQRHPKDPKLFLYSQTDPPLVITYEVDEPRHTISFRHVASPALEEKKPLFISYSHKDKEWLNALLTWLSGVDEELINLWHDRKIEPGARWREEIEDALRSARAAVLLVTQDFLASDFVKTVELPALLEAQKEGRLKLLWIAVRRSRYKDTPLVDFQALNDPEKPLFALRGDTRDSAYEDISNGIKEAVTS